MADADLTEYVGTDYPTIQYGSKEGVSNTGASVERLKAEMAEVQKIYDDVFTLFTTKLSEYAISVPAGDQTKIMYTRLGSFQVIVVSGEEFAYYGIPADNPAAKVFTADGPESKLIINNYWSATEVSSATHEISFPTSAAGDVEIILGEMPVATMSGTGDCEHLAGAGLRLHDTGGGDYECGFGDSAVYDEELDETYFGEAFIPEGVGGRLKYALFDVKDGSPDEGTWADLYKYVAEVRTLGIMLYGQPSKQGTLGLKARLDSAEYAVEAMTNNTTRCNEINDYFRGDNMEGKNYTKWEEYIDTTEIDTKYIDISGAEWTTDSSVEMDEVKLAIYGDLESENPSGTKFLLDTTVDSVSGHSYTIVKEAVYHDPEFATYCEAILSPDVMSTINFKNVTDSSEFADLVINDDISSIAVSDGSTYSKVMYKNPLTIWIAGASKSSLPDASTTNPSSITVTHSNGLVNYFQMYKSTDGVDPFAGYTVFEFENGLPIKYKIDIINKESEP